ncbi:MAG: peptidylprolyl isomerase [Bacteroidota bacterium]|nr:peptidylprolyl isomerase [Bacteroidota bacterium]
MKKIIYFSSLLFTLVFVQACKKVSVTADFKSNVQSGNSPLVIAFTDLSTISSSSITSWLWNFGDGTTATEQNPSHTYTTSGSYDVTLTASGKDASNVQTKKAYITVNAPTEKIIEIKTSFGTMYMWLYKQTPKHRANFLKLADSGFFDNTTFHRIVKDFVIQGGDPNSKDADPTNDGQGGPGYTIPAELSDTSLKHVYGAIGAARTNNPQKASSGSQFYVVTNKTGTHQLDKNYTVFGKLIGGVDIAYTISIQSKDGTDRPFTDIKMDVNVLEKTLEQLKTEFNFVP